MEFSWDGILSRARSMRGESVDFVAIQTTRRHYLPVARTCGSPGVTALWP